MHTILKYPSAPPRARCRCDEVQQPAKPKSFKFATILTETEILKKFQDLEAAENLKKQEKIERKCITEEKKAQKNAKLTARKAARAEKEQLPEDEQ